MLTPYKFGAFAAGDFRSSTASAGLMSLLSLQAKSASLSSHSGLISQQIIMPPKRKAASQSEDVSVGVQRWRREAYARSAVTLSQPSDKHVMNAVLNAAASAFSKKPVANSMLQVDGEVAVCSPPSRTASH